MQLGKMILLRRGVGEGGKLGGRRGGKVALWVLLIQAPAESVVGFFWVCDAEGQ